jgi:multidrug efflux pump subunit AcrB
MAGFSIRNPYFIIVICLVLVVIGVTSLARMPVDLFPPINLPEVVVATFYSGMPPEDVETDITDPLERFFTLASGVDHMESRSLLGVSIIKVYFQPGTSPDADVTELSNLALADLKRLPPGTLPPVVLKFDASSLPVALVTVKGEGLNQTQSSRSATRSRLFPALRFPACLAGPTARSWSMSTHTNCRRASLA